MIDQLEVDLSLGGQIDNVGTAYFTHRGRRLSSTFTPIPGAVDDLRVTSSRP